MEFKRVFGWLSDDMPGTTEAVVWVSNTGIVKVCAHQRWNTKNKSYSKIKEVEKVATCNRGKQRREASREDKYLHVYICHRAYSVHRLVALAWIPNPENKPQVNHKNGIRDDNRVENLEWVTNLENATHSKQFPRANPRGAEVKTSKLSEAQVKTIRRALKTPYRGQGRRLAKAFGVSESTITWIKQRGTWDHV